MNARPSVARHWKKKQAREITGLNQEEYAAFCQVSKSNLALIETNRREWPYDSREHHWRFCKAVKAAEQIPLPEAPDFASLPEDEKKMAFIQLVRCQKESDRIWLALEMEKCKYEAAFRLQEVCKELAPHYPDAEPSLSSVYLMRWAKESIKTLEAIPAWTWKLREMELESLKQKIDWLKAYVGDWKPEDKT